MIVRPNMVCNVGSFRAALDVSNVFFFSSEQTSTRFTDVIPRAVSTSDLVNNVGLKFNGWPEFW